MPWGNQVQGSIACVQTIVRFYFPAASVEASQPPILPSYRSRTSTVGESQSFGTASLASTLASPFWLSDTGWVSEATLPSHTSAIAMASTPSGVPLNCPTDGSFNTRPVNSTRREPSLPTRACPAPNFHTLPHAFTP